MDIDTFEGGITASYRPDGTYEVLNGPPADSGHWRGFRGQLKGYTVVWPEALKKALQQAGHDI